MENINSIDDIRNLRCYDGRNTPRADSCIYFILRGDKVIYVGQTTDISRRAKQYNHLIMFSIIVNERISLYYSHCNKRELKAEEQYYINKFTPALNKERKNIVDKQVIEKFNGKQKTLLNRHTFVLQCLAEKRDAHIHFRLPLWMKSQTNKSGKSEADFIIAKLAEDLYKPLEIDEESWAKEVEEMF